MDQGKDELPLKSTSRIPLHQKPHASSINWPPNASNPALRRWNYSHHQSILQLDQKVEGKEKNKIYGLENQLPSSLGINWGIKARTLAWRR